MTDAAVEAWSLAGCSLTACLPAIINLAVAGDTGPRPAAQRVFVNTAVAVKESIESDARDQNR
jgi:hypothetical protein